MKTYQFRSILVIFGRKEIKVSRLKELPTEQKTHTETDLHPFAIKKE